MQIFGKKCVGKFPTFLKSGLLGGGWFGRTATDRKVPCPLGVMGNYGFYPLGPLFNPRYFLREFFTSKTGYRELSGWTTA